MTSTSNEPASLWRRLAAMLYDGFLILALWFISAIVLVAMNNGEELPRIPLQIFLYLETALFYTYFWRVKGQTLGMQVWKIRTVTDTEEILTLGECAVRFFFATFSFAMIGLGFLWILFDPEKLAWHDRASGTRVLYLGEDPYGKEAAKQQKKADKAARKKPEKAKTRSKLAMEQPGDQLGDTINLIGTRDNQDK